MNFDIDYVLTYVDMNDPNWRRQHDAWMAAHRDHTQTDSPSRYTDFGFFRYVFRALAANAPWLRQVHLIVESPSQLPKWLNTDMVHVVYHKDIMPTKILPTYNSQTIEMFVPDIEGLAEHFIYANDDMYVVGPTEPEDWFTDESHIRMNFTHHTLSAHPSIFHKLVNTQWHQLARALGWKSGPYNEYTRPNHDICPMIKNDCIKAREALLPIINAHLEPLRNEYQHNQYIYPTYTYLMGRAVESERNFKYLSTRCLPQDVAYYIRTREFHTMVLNDDSPAPFRDDWIQSPEIIAAFEALFPEPCKYEKPE